MLPVGDVAGGEGDTGPGGLEFGGEFGGAVGGGAAAGGEDQVLGAAGGEAAGEVPGEGAAAAGDEDGAARCPGPGGGRGRGAAEPAHEASGGAHGDVFLGGGGAVGGEGGQQLAGLGVPGVGGQVDESAPAAGVFEGDDVAEAPDVGLGGVRCGVGGVGRDGAPGEEPQRGPDRRVRERLHEREAVDGTGGHGGVGGVRGGVGGGEGEDTGEGVVAECRREVADEGGAGGPVVAGGQDVGVGAASARAAASRSAGPTAVVGAAISQWPRRVCAVRASAEGSQVSS